VRWPPVPKIAISQGLSAFVPVKRRSRARSVNVLGQPVTLIDDTYNANPDGSD
jgi:UDP-N-acetylmuramoyl-tripeptide--D-alanyl-D-alanine ligase